MPIVKLDVEYIDSMGAWLKRVSERMRESPKKFLEHIGKRIRYRFQVNIRDSQTAQGVRFEPLKRSRRKGHNQSMLPLYDTGRLFNSIRWELTAPDTVEIGEDTYYGVWQNRGTIVIPPRAFITLSPEKDLPPEDLYRFAASYFDYSTAEGYSYSDNLNITLY